MNNNISSFNPLPNHLPRWIERNAHSMRIAVSILLVHIGHACNTTRYFCSWYAQNVLWKRKQQYWFTIIIIEIFQVFSLPHCMQTILYAWMFNKMYDLFIFIFCILIIIYLFIGFTYHGNLYNGIVLSVQNFELVHIRIFSPASPPGTHSVHHHFPWQRHDDMAAAAYCSMHGDVRAPQWGKHFRNGLSRVGQACS